MTDEEFLKLSKQLDEEKKAFLKANPYSIPDADFYDAHSCSMFADEFGFCQWCGAVVEGSYAYKELYGDE